MSDRLRHFLGPELLPLLEDGTKLLESTSSTADSTLPAGRQGYSDYSFVVFPFAKVYEGFLKKLFLEIGAISEQQYNNDRWRVGRALNPQLEKELRHTESVYDRIVEYCGGSFDPADGGTQDSRSPRQTRLRSAQNPENGQSLADSLWQVWKRGRNQIFHFWPGRSRGLSLGEAKEIVGEIEKVMEKALTQCRIKY